MFTQLTHAQVFSLSQLYQPGKFLLDTDGDGLVDKLDFTIIIPDNPTAVEISLASELAARANLESLAVYFDLIKKESETKNLSAASKLVLISDNLTLSKKILKDEKIDPTSLKLNQGMILSFSYQGSQGLLLLAGSEETLLETGRSYFLRWPYFWEVWGRESGFTFLKFEEDLNKFLSAAGVKFNKIVVKSLLYSFPPLNVIPAGLSGLNYKNSGEISRMSVDVYFSDGDDQQKALSSLRLLSGLRSRGMKTDLLAYPSCAEIELKLISGSQQDRVLLPRPGSSKRLLTPPFKEFRRAPEKGKQFDLTELFTTRGIYADGNQDGLNDDLEAYVVIPEDFGATTLSSLTSRLTLETTGCSFPITLFDKEVENPKILTAPFLIGNNLFTRELLKSGQLKIPPLKPYQGLIRVVPAGFGSSDIIVVYSQSPAGLEKTLEYLGKRFPYLTDFAKGQPEISWIKEDFHKFLGGEKGAAGAFFLKKLEETALKLKNQALERLEVEIFLPSVDSEFQTYLEKYLKTNFNSDNINLTIKAGRESKEIFQKEKILSWEVDDALKLIQNKILPATTAGSGPLKISLGLSEPPTVRAQIKNAVEKMLMGKNLTAEVEVLSAYKPGFFWLTEKIVPSLKNRPVQRMLIRCAKFTDSPVESLKRFYQDPYRWLQELYPVDEIISQELNLPLEKIDFEIKPSTEPVYEVYAFDDKNNVLLHESFSPQTREIPYLHVMPDWGTVLINTGWLKAVQGQEILWDGSLTTDLEKIWDFYQEEGLKPLRDFILKKTGFEPTFAQQPYFKKLTAELWLSEPDFRLGLDEEIISATEALHDELYFDTLDFLRGLTKFPSDEVELPKDASRSSAPGNVFPIIHTREGKPPRISLRLEDFSSLKPVMTIKWQVADQPLAQQTFEFRPIKPKSLRLNELVYNASGEILDSVGLEVQLENERDYKLLSDLLDRFTELRDSRVEQEAFNYPGVEKIRIKVIHQEISVEKSLNVLPLKEKEPEAVSFQTIPTDRILGPEECWKLTLSLKKYPVLHPYEAGRSFEGQPVPVIEAYLPAEKYVSRPRLITFKPVLYLLARQHANEVSSTNYSLKFAELLGRDYSYQQLLKKINVVIEPMENPDGARLALELMKNEPFHSLHAGRYSALGVDIGYQVGLSQPLLPEARVRAQIMKDWLPDVFLNLHGYPSHEWVQLFSGYSPYLFRDYWIPKGWFAYLRQVNLDVFGPYKTAAEELKKALIQEMNADPRIKETNQRFYYRYERWAKRWSPFVSPLEIYQGLNLFAKRQSSQETRLTARNQITWMEETPEVMDETATGQWLQFLCDQGLVYLRAHAKHLYQGNLKLAVIEEEVNDRIRVEFYRSRPVLSGK
ncbi:MAG: hypothetical protein H5U07_04505 [Candidatus Aminicenantes bacterium]|nr:hypothetical protein [Candidatus Aminicenantes bacterium]